MSLACLRQVVEMERRILKTVEETRQVGANTLTKLHAQHEQLNSVSAAQVKVSKSASLYSVSVRTYFSQSVGAYPHRAGGGAEGPGNS